MLYGHKPNYFGFQATDSCQVQELDSWVQDRDLMQSVIKQHLIHAQLRMKKTSTVLKFR
jgi:hypothetical protein